MFLATAPILYRLVADVFPDEHNQRIGMLISASLTLVSAIHATMDELILHPVTFAVMILIIGYLTLRKLRQLRQAAQRSGLAKKRRELEESQADSLSRRALWGAVSFVLGFALWVVDMTPKGCAMLLRWQVKIGRPWAFLLELHGW